MAELPSVNIPEDPNASFVGMKGAEGEKRCFSAPPSVENSPLLDRESILRYSASSRDEFWDALSSNYDYLMDDGLIATCREASSDLSLDDESEMPEACCWTFTRFIEQFKWLHDLLHNLQVAKDDDSCERSAKIYEEQQKIAYLCKLFNEQAQKLCKRYPDMRDEVHRRLNLLNNKWKAVEQSINPNIVKSPSKDSMFDEITNRMSSLRRWLRDMESRLCPVSSASSWSIDTLEENYKMQIALQKEIEGKGKNVSMLLKLCEHLKGNVRFGQNALMTWDAERVRKVAKNLEHRWHSIWLKSLECQCVLEELLSSSKTGSEKLEKSFSEEPLKKYPRLSDNYETIALLENELKSKMSFKSDDVFVNGVDMGISDHAQSEVALQKNEVTAKNDKAVMVGDTGIAELKADCAGGSGKFEIVQDIGYSSETSAHLSTDEKPEGAGFHEKNDSFNNISEPSVKSPCNVSVTSSPKVYLAPDKYPSVSLKTLHILSEDRSFYNSKHSCKSVPDSFYKVACVDDDALEDAAILQKECEPSKANSHRTSCVIAEPQNKTEQVTLPNTPKTHRSHESSRIKNLLKSIEKDVAVNKFPDSVSSTPVHKKGRRTSKVSVNNCVKVLQPSYLWKKSPRVCEWLNTCQPIYDGISEDNLEAKEKIKGDWPLKVVNSSCDASGECTTTESDSEKSTTSDVNNSVTFSQSFTGSIETVIPAVAEDSGVVQSDRAGSLEPSPGGVRMRKKKRPIRDRPWSVIELHQAAFTSTSVPHSTSEGALDLLYSSQDSGKTISKKLCPKNKRLSLTDISNLCSPSIKPYLLNQKGLSDQNSRNSSSSERRTSRKKKESASDQSSDNCGTLLCSPNTVLLDSIHSVLPSLELDASKHTDKLADVQIILSETNSLPETLLSIDTDVPAASTEDQASLSDQAWDEYQDPPYLSEPYSEQTVDEDEVRKLISFGDDYRATLGSYSDASSVSLRLPPPRHRTKTRSSVTKSMGGESYGTLSSDTNSDSEDFHHILKTSGHAFQYVSNSIKESTTKMSSLSSEFAELVATCQTNLCHLNAIANAGCELESVSKEDVLKLQDLIKNWEELQVKLLVLSRSDKESNVDLEAATIDVHSSLASLKEKLSGMAEHATDAFDTALSLEQVITNIQNLQTGLSNLQDIKESVLSLSVRILRLISEGGGHSLAPLKESATKLYRQWEDVYELNCSQLTKLQTLQSRWGESTEEQIKEDLETTVQWQPVQVGNSLPTAEVKREALHPSTAAEIQMADQHDILFEIEKDSSRATIQCILVEGNEEELQEPLMRLNLPVQKLSGFKKLDGDSKSSENPSTNTFDQNRSCLWRTLRAAVPIQFALVLLYCLSCLMEPQCCENINNYDFSLLPQLRYLRGPPPV